MLRNNVSKVLFNKLCKDLNNSQIKICNDFIDNYNDVKELEDFKKEEKYLNKYYEVTKNDTKI